MIIELEINGARVIISGENLTVNVSDDGGNPIVRHEVTSCRPSLREWIKSKRLTQAEFAEMIGTHQVNLNRVINGKRRPSWSMIKKIERATGGEITVHSFMPEGDS